MREESIVRERSNHSPPYKGGVGGESVGAMERVCSVSLLYAFLVCCAGSESSERRQSVCGALCAEGRALGENSGGESWHLPDYSQQFAFDGVCESGES